MHRPKRGHDTQLCQKVALHLLLNQVANIIHKHLHPTQHEAYPIIIITEGQETRYYVSVDHLSLLEA